MDSLPLLAGHPYAAFLDKIEKPARYAGGEVGTVVKDWSTVEATVCLAFPDVYDIGMSHLGYKILYKILNDDPRTLAERCYAPWVDLEAELRGRALPLVSLESARPLRDFDVVGFSLQFELTYTNILTMLDLGGIPLRAADRGERDPLVIGGGPTATHPEPLAPFFDAFVIGDGEEKATEVALTWTRLRARGVPRRERLIALAKLGAVYVPSLYATAIDADTGLGVVTGPTVAGIPFPVERSLVDLNAYPFPSVSPTGGPEAIFDRMSIEIARGCTEGCRFCQAGMIYRPVRERDPEQIVETVLAAVKSSGQDEVSLTALSTADVSCISPLLKKVAGRLAQEKISLGVSSLRAYGLEPELLDEIKRVRATGLTFAPEAGSQRMRDVVNKNVTEEQLHETAERVFSRGWGKMKLYFMIGLPTEDDADVRGIVETGARTAAVGKRAAKGRPADVTVSVSTHVPKPHTPFQWAAMDPLSEVSRKQQILKETVRPHRAVTLRTHEAHASVLEGIFARGDRALADVLETAYKKGARFDSWDERLRLDLWEEAFVEHGVERAKYLGTLPITARLPWSHIDVGLEDGFLAREYRKALQSRLSPPCGKAAGMFVHHTNVDDALADPRRLVCYDCGVACDMTQMREERVTFLHKLGAEHRVLPVIKEPKPAPQVEAAPAAPIAAVEPVAAIEPVESTVDTSVAEVDPALPIVSGAEPALPQPKPAQRPRIRYRFRYEKTGPTALLGHLDVVRELPRIFRRIGVPLIYTQGFHPKPDMSFGPALSLGVLSLDEHADIRVDADLEQPALDALVADMSRSAPSGLRFRAAIRLSGDDPGITKVIAGARYLLAFARSSLPAGRSAESVLAERCAAGMSAATLPFRREIEGVGKMLDVRSYLLRAEVAGPEALALLGKAGLAGDLVAIDVDAKITGSGAVKASEIAAVLVGDSVTAPPHRAVRVELFGEDPLGRFSPMELGRGRKPRSTAVTAAATEDCAAP
ncbi:MAG: TIGR03960 family B12-binding radical SAM protein [Byssovorax sp.]